MTVKELSEYLRLDRMTIYKRLKERSIPASRIGHQWRFLKSDIDEWLRSLRIGQKVTLLVVDDEPTVRALFQEELSEGNFEVMAASSGKEALELASKVRFDLIFLDLKMPEMNGVTTFARLRSLDQEVPVVIITGYPESDLMAEAMQIGPFAVMKKPFSGEDVRNVTATFLLRKLPLSTA